MNHDRILNKTAKILLSSLELDITLKEVTQFLLENVDSIQACAVFCYSTSKGHLDIIAYAGPKPSAIVQDTAAGFFKTEQLSKFVRPEDKTEMLMFRLIGYGFPVGVLSFIGTDIHGMEALLSEIAEIMAPAIHNGVSYQNLIAERNFYDEFTRETRELYQLTKSLSTAFNSEEVINNLLKGMADIYKAQVHALLLVLDGKGKLFFNFNTHFDIESLEVIKKKLKRTWSVLVESELEEIEYRILSLPSLQANTKGLEIKKESQIKSWLSAPLLIGEQHIGLLCVISTKLNRFRAHHLEILYFIAGLAAKVLENAHLNERLKLLATTDGLTEVYNHRTFQEKLEEHFSIARRYKSQLSLILLDIDHFKRFNDTYGHQTGDDVLKLVSKTIKKTMRDVDITCRYGGEEFVIIMPQVNTEAAFTAAERLRKAIEAASFQFENQELKITISLGISTFPDGEQVSREDLIAQADAMLYKAKKAGRNQAMAWQKSDLLAND